MEANKSLLTVKDLVKHFDISGGLLDQLALESGRLVRKKTTVKALNAVSFQIKPQETLGVVGESGCGKTTVLRTIAGFEQPGGGRRLDVQPQNATAPGGALEDAGGQGVGLMGDVADVWPWEGMRRAPRF